MNELYKRRKNTIEKCLEEQQELCDALDQACQQLALDPLATESEVQEFELYLIDLKSEKLRRENDIDNLKSELGSLYVELDLAIPATVLKE